MYIPPDFITRTDEWLDSDLSPYYAHSATANDQRRIIKIANEFGEVLEAFATWTGENPRKPQDDAGYSHMLDELADVVVTATLAIQHFTKDAAQTNAIVRQCILKIMNRLPPASGDLV